MLYIQGAVVWYVAYCCKFHNGLHFCSLLFGLTLIFGPTHIFILCSSRRLSMLCCSPCRARIGYLCVAGRWCSLGCVCGRSTPDAFEGVCMGVGWTGIFVRPTTGIYFYGVGIVAGCGGPVVVGAFCTDTAVSKIVASFLRAAR